MDIAKALDLIVKLNIDDTLASHKLSEYRFMLPKLQRALLAAKLLALARFLTETE